jgi:hypothetical protein
VEDRAGMVCLFFGDELDRFIGVALDDAALLFVC